MRIRAGFRIAATLAVASALSWGCGSGSGAAAAGGPVAGVPVAGVPAAAAPATGPALASLTPGRAVLVSGSRPVRGLPGLGHNALPAIAGEYAYLPGASAAGKPPAGPLKVEVWFTRERLVFPSGWDAGAPGACGTLPAGFSALASLPEEGGSTLWALGAAPATAGAAGYTVLVRVPRAMGDACRFIAVFAERLGFFQRYAERDEDASFPAILDIGR